MATVYDSDQQEQQADSQSSVSPEQVRDMERSFAAPAYGEKPAKGPKNDGGADKWGDSSKKGWEKDGSTGQHTPSPRELGSQEQQPKTGSTGAAHSDNRESDQLFRNTGEGKYRSDSKKGKGFWNKKRAGIAGILSGGVVGGGILGLSFISGPLEFVHIAQLLHDTHFSSQETTSNSRMSQIIRYLGTGERGETRLGNLASQYHARIDAKLRAAGINLEYKGPGGTLSRATIDTTNRASAYYGMSEEDLRSSGLKPTSLGKGVYEFNASGFLDERSVQRAAVRGIAGNMAVTAVRNRVFGKYGLTNFSPLSVIDRTRYNTTAKISAYLKDKWDSMTKGTTTTVEVHPPTDKDGKVTSGAQSEANAARAAADQALNNATGIANQLQNPGDIGSGFGRFAQGLLGPVSAVQSIACPFVAVNENVKALRYVMIILPLIRAGMDIMVIGNQIKTGHNVDPVELKYLAKSFNQLDTNGTITGKKGAYLNNWFDAKSIRANQGLAGGIDALKLNGTKNMLVGDGHVPILSWANNKALERGCTTGAQVTGGLISLGITIVSAGSADGASVGITTVVRQGIKSMFQALTKDGIKATTARAIKFAGKQGAIYFGTKAGIDILTNFLKGEAVTIAQGAEWGEDIDYGTALGANASNLSLGGVALTPTNIAELNADNRQQQEQTFQQESFFARMFDVYDRNSLISRFAIDNINPSFTLNIYNLASALLHMGSTLGSLGSSIFTMAHADTVQPYDYGFPIFGYSKEDLNNPSVQDPIKNAANVGTMLSNTCLDGNGIVKSSCPYIAEAQQCFAVDIQYSPDSNGPNGRSWDVVPLSQGAGNSWDMALSSKTDGSDMTFDPYNPTKYDISHCAQPPDITKANWLKLRFFILDTGSMEGFTCGEFSDATSCANDGVTNV